MYFDHNYFNLAYVCRPPNQCSRKRGQPLKKNVKSHVFWILKKRKKR